MIKNRVDQNASYKSAFQIGLDHILREAFRRGASDIHIEPQEHLTQIRIRIDGVLHELPPAIIAPEYRIRLAEQAKKICGFDLGKMGKPQDARFSHADIPVNFRSSLIPTLYGEKIVLRLLERNKAFSLDSYPLPSLAREKLTNALGLSSGLVIVSGPTGSGKSTLLYSALSSLDRSTQNIHTLEDPIEYTLPGLNQTEMTSDVTFVGALRSLMRQDPDVIYVGEVRDEETAGAVINAAKTGHLVLTTIHANSAKEILSRLVGLGVKQEDIKATLAFASAQRLVPKNCPHCARGDPESKEKLLKLFTFEGESKTSPGCEQCNFTGIKGRSLLFEFLTKETNEQNKKVFTSYGNLRQNVIQLLNEGIINAENACSFA